ALTAPVPHLARHGPRPLAPRLREPLLRLELVADLPDNLFQDVLERDQAGGPSVLVDDDRGPELLRLELAEERVGALGLRHEVRRGEMPAEVEVRGEPREVG